MKLSDEAMTVAKVHFNFGPRTTLTIRPPHKTLHLHRAGLDELVAKKLITHKHITSKFGHDDHVYKGSQALTDILRGRA